VTESPGGYLEVTDKRDLDSTNIIIFGQTITSNRLRLSSGTNFAIISAGPTYDETKGLIIRHSTGYLGGESVAGGKLKETGTIHRTSSNTDANNVTGFTGLPGGLRCYDNTFMSIGTQGWWWTTTQDTGPYNPYYRDMNNSTSNCYSGSTRSDHGLSVCCV
jgi:uncharacterized protein (TIGR02145 family)